MVECKERERERERRGRREKEGRKKRDVFFMNDESVTDWKTHL